ncbi:MAG: CHAT domain-containing protein [Lysobacterales bacterium]
MGLTALLGCKGIAAFPCFDVASAQQCWRDYASNIHDPDYHLARNTLQLRKQQALGPAGLLELSLAQVSFLQGDYEGVVTNATEAAHQCMIDKRVACEMQARRFLANALDQLGQQKRSIWEAEKTFALAQLLASPLDQVKVASALARSRIYGLDDIPRALEVLEVTEPYVGSVDPVTRLFFRHWQGQASARLGQLNRAILALRAVARETPDTRYAGLGQISQAEALGIELRLAPNATQKQNILGQLQRLIDDPDLDTQVRIHALFLRHAHMPDATSEAELGRCVETAIETGHHELTVRCQTQLAITLAEKQPQSARRWLTAAASTLEQGRTPELELTVTRAELRLLWNEPVTKATVDRSLTLLNTVERARKLQQGNRATELLGFLGDEHYWLADQIVTAVQAHTLPKQALATALGILEQARSRRRSATGPAQLRSQRLHQWVQRRQGRLASPQQAPLSLQHFLADESAPPMDSLLATDNIGQFSLETLPANQTALVFQWHHNHAFARRVFLLEGKNITVMSLDTDNRADTLLIALDQAIRAGDEEAAEGTLLRLGEILIQPLLKSLGRTSQPLVIFLDGELHGLPLSTLPDAPASLVTASYFGSIEAWKNHLNPTTTHTTTLDNMALFANPEPPVVPLPGSKIVPNANDLPATLIEAQGIAEVWPNAEFKQGLSASETALRAALQSEVGWLHFAGHVKIQSDNPSQSSMQLAPDLTHDGWLTAAEISQLTLPPKVVVLSACESANGRRLSGQGVVGLSSALLDAGASAVVANLWPVDDAYAASFVQRWYQRLGLGLSLAEGLEQTRVEFRHAGYPASAWAGWSITGQSNIKPQPLPQRAPFLRWQRLMTWMFVLILAGAVFRLVNAGYHAKANP